jgi:hypothetical protein
VFAKGVNPVNGSFGVVEEVVDAVVAKISSTHG